MKLCSSQLLLPIFIIFSLLPLSKADINADKKALLAFAALVPHSPKLKWDNDTTNGNASYICTSWAGIVCTADNARVLIVRLPAVGLTGPIPSGTLGELDALRVLSLRSNRLSGSLPSDLLSLPSLRSLFLQHNNFTTNIPTFFPHRLHILDLSFNSFTGNIPPNIQLLTRLTGLYLHNNSLSGRIPDIRLSKLKHLNISYNNLKGRIPSSFKAFPSSSFIGNPLLCGKPLKSCRHTLFKKKFSVWAVAAMAFVTLLLVVAFVFGCLRKKSSDERTEKPKEEFSSGPYPPEHNKLVFFEGSSYNFNLDDLLSASAEVIGRGSLGVSYKAALDELTTVVMKRLSHVDATKLEFQQQLELIRSVGKHQNVATLHAFYYSTDEKLLLYDYYAAGSLMALLHGNTGPGRTPFAWEPRFKVALGTAKGIAHIHSIGGPTFTLGNIKSSNILIDQDMEARITDIGLIPIMNIPLIPSSHSSGYQAPEVLETKVHTHKSDIYSFGILLLEILTGKKPFQSPSGGEMVDLLVWVQKVVKEEWTTDVFDVELMRSHTPETEMIKMLQIALTCVVKVPDKRPSITEVVGRIEDIGSLSD
ncbi:probable inactive receptor kinase [Tanacetum coccineum]|uniref:Probable inactive receptor kinase n=1 Tax=Tanacetum coccineum TaxID=301880 RepID=A0ABQ5GSG0_9ASTR